MAERLVPTTVVGSHPQPDWLVNRELFQNTAVPRARMREMWRVDDPYLMQAQDDATIVAIQEMESAGIDTITDGEIRRESYSNRFATALEGVAEEPAVLRTASGAERSAPRIVGAIHRKEAVEVRDMQFLRDHTQRTAKITLPGPFTMAQQAINEFYGDGDEMTMAFAAAVNEEARDLQAAGADVIQLDEPWVRNAPEAAERIAVKAINRALEGITVRTVVHLCFGYAARVKTERPSGYSFLPQLADSVAEQISIEAAQPNIDLGVLKDLSNKTMIIGVISLGDPEVETSAQVADRLRAALKHVEAGRLVAAPDCGMKYVPRQTALGKLASLAKGAEIVRSELS